MWNVGKYLSKFSPDIQRDGCVPMSVRKEMNRRALIRKHEGHELNTLLSDKYLAGIAMVKTDWIESLSALCVLNPSKRMKLANRAETRSGKNCVSNENENFMI